MRLNELNPRYIMRGEEKVGFLFLCPHCKVTTIFCTIVGLSSKQQMTLMHEQFPNNHGDVILAKSGLAWAADSQDFNSMSVTPSIDSSAAGHWHGFITKGQIV